VEEREREEGKKVRKTEREWERQRERERNSKCKYISICWFVSAYFTTILMDASVLERKCLHTNKGNLTQL
jgi:hypothetical protein